MKLSILILTHNRPKLFERCLKSALKNKPDYVEIIVNNDSSDITEIPGISYFYNKHNDLSCTYEFLFDKAQGEYIYFLEDDDYLTDNFYKLIDFNYDINYMNYWHFDEHLNLTKYKFFEIENENKLFQLGQIMFKKSLLTEFPKGNALHNDWNLFQSIKNKGTIKIINNKMFIQTQDGKDNISSQFYCSDERFK